MHISSSYAKILGETNFQPRGDSLKWVKNKNGEEREREKERPKVGNNNGQLCIENSRKPPGPKVSLNSAEDQIKLSRPLGQLSMMLHFSSH